MATPRKGARPKAQLQERKAAKKSRKEQQEEVAQARKVQKQHVHAENSAHHRELVAKANIAAHQAIEAVRATAADVPRSIFQLDEPGDRVKYDDELDRSLYRLVSTGHSLDYIAGLPNAPSVFRMLDWIATKDHPFSATYLRAKQAMATLYEERIQQNAVTPLVGKVTVTRTGGKDGGTTEVREQDNVSRSILIDGAYKFALGYIMPKRHGRNAQPEGGGANEQLEGLFAALKQGPMD